MIYDHDFSYLFITSTLFMIGLDSGAASAWIEERDSDILTLLRLIVGFWSTCTYLPSNYSIDSDIITLTYPFLPRNNEYSQINHELLPRDTKISYIMQSSCSLPESCIPEPKSRSHQDQHSLGFPNYGHPNREKGAARSTRKSICDSTRKSVKLRRRSLICACKLRRWTGSEVIRCRPSSRYLVQRWRRRIS
jgi:hypothetical protein